MMDDFSCDCLYPCDNYPECGGTKISFNTETMTPQEEANKFFNEYMGLKWGLSAMTNTPISMKTQELRHLYQAIDQLRYNRAKREFEETLKNIHDLAVEGKSLAKSERLEYESKIHAMKASHESIQYERARLTDKVNVLESRIKELESLLADKEGWIRCEDRLPEDFTRVIVWSDVWRDMKPGVYIDYCQPDAVDHYRWTQYQKITHWRPLPKPPIDTKEK